MMQPVGAIDSLGAIGRLYSRGCVIMAHLGRRPRASGSVIDLSQLPSPSPSGSYHLNHSDSTLSIRMQKRRWSNFDTAPWLFMGFVMWGRFTWLMLGRRRCADGRPPLARVLFRLFRQILGRLRVEALRSDRSHRCPTWGLCVRWL